MPTKPKNVRFFSNSCLFIFACTVFVANPITLYPSDAYSLNVFVMLSFFSSDRWQFAIIFSGAPRTKTWSSLALVCCQTVVIVLVMGSNTYSSTILIIPDMLGSSFGIELLGLHWIIFAAMFMAGVLLSAKKSEGDKHGHRGSAENKHAGKGAA